MCKRKFIAYLLLCCFIACSCAKKPPHATRSNVRMSMMSEPLSLDPRKARDLNSKIVISMLFEPLMRLSTGGVLEMAAAQTIDITDDGLAYTFHLKESRWSNGEMVTASDFAFAWKSILDPTFPGDLAYQLYPIKNARKAFLGEVSLDEVGIRVIDPSTLVVTLEEPTPYFLELLTMTPFSPVPSALAKQNPTWAMEADTLVCNGPFCMKEWVHTDHIALQKNPLYREKNQVALEEIDLIVVAAETGLKMLEDNALDWTGSPLASLPSDAVKMLREQGKLQASPYLGTGFLRVNVEGPILSNKEVRRALALSLDRRAIVEHFLQGGQLPALRLVPPSMGLCPDGYFSDRAIEEAKECLARSPVDQPLVLSYAANERNASIAQALQQQWQKNLGITIELEAVESKTFFQKVSRKEYQMALGSWIADFNDPINFLEVFQYKDSGTNNTGWENKRYVDLLNQSAVCTNKEERQRLLQAAESLLMEEMPLIPIYHLSINYVKHPSLQGIVVSSQGFLDLRFAHWEGL